MKRSGLYQRVFKRPLDFLFALTALIIFSPVLLVIAILVRYYLGRPVICKEKRPGQYERLFTLYKFRTKTQRSDAQMEGGKRQEKFGEFLRASSLEVLPELVNVLKGEMSVVGPRPLLLRYQPYFHGNERLRHVVRPGMTGLTQVLGWNALTWDERLQIDVHYVKTLSFRMDVRIAMKTAAAVLRGEHLRYGVKPFVKDLEKERRGGSAIEGEWEMSQNTLEERGIFAGKKGCDPIETVERGKGFSAPGKNDGIPGYGPCGEEPQPSEQVRSL